MEGGPWRGYDGVEQQFGGGKVRGWDCFVPWVVDEGADDCESCSFFFGFLRSFHHNNFAVGDILEAVLWDVLLVNIGHGLGAGNVSDAVCESA